MRQAAGQVDCIVEMHGFQWSEALVVIHREDGVKAAVISAVKHRIGRRRANDRGTRRRTTACEHGRDGRGDDPAFFVAKHPLITGVRIQAANSDSRGSNAEGAAQCLEQKHKLLFHQSLGQGCGHVAQG